MRLVLDELRRKDPVPEVEFGELSQMAVKSIPSARLQVPAQCSQPRLYVRGRREREVRHVLANFRIEIHLRPRPDERRSARHVSRRRGEDLPDVTQSARETTGYALYWESPELRGRVLCGAFQVSNGDEIAISVLGIRDRLQTVVRQLRAVTKHSSGVGQPRAPCDDYRM